MSTIWQDNLTAVYESALAVDGTLAPGSGADAIAVRAMDKTSGVMLNSGDIDVQSIVPVAVIRMSSLTDEGLTHDDLDGGTITLDGKAWNIKSHTLKPSPDGELKGEVVLILSDEAV